LGDVLKRVSGQLELILDVGGGDDLNTRLGDDAANDLLAKEVTVLITHMISDLFQKIKIRDLYIPDLNLEDTSLAVLLNVHVDGKMGVDVTHLVQESAGNTDDQIVDEGTDSAEGSNTLANAVMQLDGNGALVGAAEGHGDVRKVLGKLASGSLDGDNPRANVDRH
jgi:hypothetical protein